MTQLLKNTSTRENRRKSNHCLQGYPTECRLAASVGQSECFRHFLSSRGRIWGFKKIKSAIWVGGERNQRQGYPIIRVLYGRREVFPPKTPEKLFNHHCTDVSVLYVGLKVYNPFKMNWVGENQPLLVKQVWKSFVSPQPENCRCTERASRTNASQLTTPKTTFNVTSAFVYEQGSREQIFL